MGFRKIWHQIGLLSWRLLTGTSEKVAEGTPELHWRAAACDLEKPDGNGHRLRPLSEDCEQAQASFTPAPQRADVQVKGCFSAIDFARAVLGPNSSATISNVLVLGTRGSAPLKRTKINFEDPKEVPAILSLLVITLQRNGLEFRAVRNSEIPATEIWFTSPLHNGNKPLLSCVPMAGLQVDQRVPPQQAASPQGQPQ